MICRDCAVPIGKRNASGLCRPCVARSLSATPAIVAQRSAATSNSRLAWCPPELRQMNRALKRNHISLDLRKALITDVARRAGSE